MRQISTSWDMNSRYIIEVYVKWIQKNWKKIKFLANIGKQNYVLNIKLI